MLWHLSYLFRTFQLIYLFQGLLLFISEHPSFGVASA